MGFNLAFKGLRLHIRTYNEIVITFPLQQWLHERASVLGYPYIACLVIINVVLTVHKTIYLLKQIRTSLSIAIRLDLTYKTAVARV